MSPLAPTSTHPARRAPGWRWLLLLLCLVPASPALAEGEHQYVGARKCKTCHGKELIGDQYATWRQGPHHRAFTTLQSERARAIAEAQALSVPAHEAAACLRCHVTAHDVPPTRIAYRMDPADGVQCESCHGPGRDYRKKKIMSDVEKARAKGLWDAGADASLCTSCHNAESPTWDPQRYRLPDGTTAGFHFEQAVARIAHPIPEDVKGRYVELEKQLKEAAKQR